MSDNILLAVGGTGARIVESLIPCLMAGLGPERLTIGFIDQDEGNGNVDRSRQRLANYIEFRREWTHGPNKINWASGGLARTDVMHVTADGRTWCPHPDRNTTLAEILEKARLSEEERGLLDMLYHADEREQHRTLGEGYRALPHVGSAALISGVLEGHPFWEKVTDRLRGARAGGEVRLFLAGSVFGGMGAAGYPTLARLIRQIERQEGLEAIKLGGCLMLPYFSFTPLKDEDAAQPEDLLVQAQGALTYYSKLFEREKVFNEIYLLGWSPRFELNYGVAGNNAQRNPPLPPDLLGALSALRFFSPLHNIGDPNNEAYICSRQDANGLKWSDLTPISDDAPTEVGECLGQLLRFCCAWRNTLRPALRQKPFLSAWPKWARNQTVHKVAFADERQKRALQLFDEVVDDTLLWAGSMSVAAKNGGMRKFGIWDVGRLIRVTDSPTEPAVLSSPLEDDARAAEAYSELIRSDDAAAAPRGQGDLIEELSGRSAVTGAEGLGRLVTAAFEAARLHGGLERARA